MKLFKSGFLFALLLVAIFTFQTKNSVREITDQDHAVGILHNSFKTTTTTENDHLISDSDSAARSGSIVAPSPPSNFLEQLISNGIRECPHTEFKRNQQVNSNTINSNKSTNIVIVSFLAVARSGSTTLAAKMRSTKKKLEKEDDGISIFDHHNHGCTLQDFEEIAATTRTNGGMNKVQLRVIVSLRHPLARISSGVSRRMEKLPYNKKANADFRKYFVIDGKNDNNDMKKKENNYNEIDDDVPHVHAAEKYVRALRNESDPYHDIALNVTFGIKKQQYMTPVSEYFLANSTYSLGITETEKDLVTEKTETKAIKTEVAFVCIDTLDDDFDAAFQRWFPPGGTSAGAGEVFSTTRKKAKGTKSKVSSGNFNTVLSRFSKDSVDWVERTYARDVALYQEHCQEGFREYTEAKMDMFHER